METMAKEGRVGWLRATRTLATDLAQASGTVLRPVVVMLAALSVLFSLLDLIAGSPSRDESRVAVGVLGLSLAIVGWWARAALRGVTPREIGLKLRDLSLSGIGSLLGLIFVGAVGGVIRWGVHQLAPSAGPFNLDDHPILEIYLLGCALVPPLALLCHITFWALAWITKGNVLAENLKKLQAPTTKAPFSSRVAKFLGTWLLEIALSWISIAVQAWRLLGLLFRTAREGLSSRPESIKLLTYPLKNDPLLAVESVWAYAYALTIRGGSPPPDEYALTRELAEILTSRPGFDRVVALRQLEALDVVKPTVIAAVAARRGEAGADEETNPEAC
jgi:hypothetical protein